MLFQTCLVSWFLNFLVSQLLCFLVSKFQVSEIQNVKVSMIPYYQMSISCFLEDIDSISKIFKSFIWRIWGIVLCPSLPNFQNVGFAFFKMYNNSDIWKCPGEFSWLFLGVLVSPKITNVGFGAWWRVPKPRNHGIWSFGLHK